MAYSDLCHIGNAYKTVENELDQSDRIMEQNNFMVEEFITKILEDPSPADEQQPDSPPENAVNAAPSSTIQYATNDTLSSFLPPTSTLYNCSYGQNDQSNYNFNVQNGFENANGFVNYPDNDANLMLGIDPLLNMGTDNVSPELLSLLRLAAQEIGGAQFTNNDKFNYNFFEPSQRNSLPETNMFPNNFNRPSSLNLDINCNNFENLYANGHRFQQNDNAYINDQNQATNDILSYFNHFTLSPERPREEPVIPNNMEYANGHYQNDEFKLQEERNKKFFNNRNYPAPNKPFNGDVNNYFLNEMISQMGERSPQNQTYDFTQPPVTQNAMNYKPNGFHPNEFMQRRDPKAMPRDGFPVIPNGNVNEQRMGFDNNMARENSQQALLRHSQEAARQMGLINGLIRNPPPPNPLNIDVSFYENPFNLVNLSMTPAANIGAMLGPSPPVPAMVPSPMPMDMPPLVPYYAMRNMRNAATPSSILNARLDACYEQWRQLERERKRTEARLALAYPGRAVSSSNSIPVPRLPPCPTRVDRLTVDMLREHTKVLTLMGKMETLRASVCVAQNKKPNKQDDPKITVLKRGQDVNGETGLDPATFDPQSWKEDVKNLAEIAPHSEVEAAMLAWRNAVGGVQAARRREMAPQPPHNPHARYQRPDPTLQLAEAVKILCKCARRARCAMWCDLTLTVALAPSPSPAPSPLGAAARSESTPQSSPSLASPKQQEKAPASPGTSAKPSTADAKEPSQTKAPDSPKAEAPAAAATAAEANKPKQQDKPQQRRPQYRNKLPQGRHDFYRHRYDNRFPHRHPFFLATGPIN